MAKNKNKTHTNKLEPHKTVVEGTSEAADSDVTDSRPSSESDNDATLSKNFETL